MNHSLICSCYFQICVPCRSSPFDSTTRDVTIHLLRAGADWSSRGLFANCDSKPRWQLDSLPGCSAEQVYEERHELFAG